MLLKFTSGLFHVVEFIYCGCCTLFQCVNMLILLYPSQQMLLVHYVLTFGPPLILAKYVVSGFLGAQLLTIPTTSARPWPLQISASGPFQKPQAPSQPPHRHSLTVKRANPQPMEMNQEENAPDSHPSDGQFWERHFVFFSGLHESRPYIDLSSPASLSSSPSLLLSELTSQINKQRPSPCPSLCFRGTPSNTTNCLRRNIWVAAGFCPCKSATENAHVKPMGAQVQEFLLHVYIGVKLLDQRLRLKFILSTLNFTK